MIQKIVARVRQIFYSVHGKCVVGVKILFKIDLKEHLDSKNDYMVSSAEDVDNSAHILSTITLKLRSLFETQGTGKRLELGRVKKVPVADESA